LAGGLAREGNRRFMPSFELSGLEVAFLEALALIALACAFVPL
jgi:hypothetical protein